LGEDREKKHVTGINKEEVLTQLESFYLATFCYSKKKGKAFGLPLFPHIVEILLAEMNRLGCWNMENPL